MMKKIDLEKINKEIEDMPIITQIRKEFYKTLIKERYEKILKYSYNKLM